MEQLKVGYARKMKLWTNRKLGTVIQSAMIVTLVRRVRLTHAYFPYSEQENVVSVVLSDKLDVPLVGT